MTNPLAPQGSLQRRLSVALTLGVTLLWLVATLAAGYVLREEIDEVFDSALQEVAQRVLPLAYIEILNRETGQPDDAQPTQISSVGAHKEYITYIVRDGAGKLMLQSHDADPHSFPKTLQTGFFGGESARFYTESAVRNTVFVTTTERPGHRLSALTKSVRMLIWPLVLLLPLSIALIWALVAFTLRPVRAFQHEIEARSGNNLMPVPIEALPQEIAPAAEAVNSLMARLRRTLEAERSFTANSAHELRTPVAAALAQTQRLIAELPEGATQNRAQAIESGLHRLTRLSEKLLQLAKAEGGGLIAETPQNITQALDFVLADLDAHAERFAVHITQAAPVLSSMDVDAFAILARNLIENALKHSHQDGLVRVSLDEPAVFCVENESPLITAEMIAHMRRPFERGATQADGSGLGLAIVDAIVHGSDASLAFYSPIPGQKDGFGVRVMLPACRSGA